MARLIGKAELVCAIFGCLALSLSSARAATLTSINVTPSSSLVVAGNTQQFSATGIYSDGSQKSITRSVTWSSTNTTVARINSTGVAKGVAVGSVTIKATSGSISGTAALQVTPAVLKSIAVTPSSVSLSPGSTKQFVATGTYTDGSTAVITNSVAWASSATSVATIGGSGLAQAVAAGSTTISATSGTIAGRATLTVKAPALVSIALSPTNPSGPLGSTVQFAATGTYSDGSTKNITSSVTWTSSSTAVATINTAGLASTVAVGSTTITATSGAISSKTALTVKAKALLSIAVTPVNGSIPLGSTEQLTATGTYSDGSTQNLTSTATWSSTGTSIATVSGTGLATSHAIGTVTIAVASGSISGQTSLTVSAAALVSISVTPTSASIPLGTTQQFTATGTFTDSTTRNLSSSATWTSSAPSAAAVGTTGLATAERTGTTNISASSGSISSNTASLTVLPAALQSIAVTPASPSIAKGTTQQFTATGTYSDGSTQNLTASVTWNSDTPAVATIATSGLATGVAAGSANIFAISGSITGSTAINVTQAQVVSIAVTPAIPSIPLGTTQQFTATGTYTDNSTQDLTDTVQWSSSNAAVATISDSVGSFGLATSKAAGSTNITATSGSVYGSTTLAVSSAELLLITVNPADPSIALGTTQQFTATGTYTDSAMQDLTSTAAWSSDATSIATIDSMGLAQTVGAGTATITATVGTVSGTTILTAAPSALISIAVAPPSPSIPLGTTQAFSATGDYADGSMQDLTSTVHWSTSDSTVATISNASGTYGVATSVAVGSVDVTAASGSISGTASLSVTPASLVSISVTPVNPTIALGRSQQFAATGTYTDKSTKDITTNVTWTSSSALVAVVSNSTGSQGLATSSGVGTATITAKMGSVSGSTGLAVGSPQLVSIAVTPANPSIPAGTTEQFSAMGSYTDNSTANLTGSVTWTSTSTAVATIGSGGIATGASRGATTITATSGSVTGSTTMTVIAPALISVTISPASPAVAQGATTQLTATGVYSDNSTQVLTATATWSSSNTAIATVSNSSGTQGLAAGVAPSSVTITAAVGAVQGTATLTVNAANPALVLGIHANTDNGASSSTTVAVNLGTPTAGSTIACSLAFSNSTAFTSVTDNVNSGSYFPAASLMREPKRNYIDGIYYHENVAASATKVTLTYTPAEAHGRMACVEIKNTPTAYALDSSFVAGQAASAANPTAGTSLTPNMNGEFVYAGLSSDGGTNSAGPNYTLLNPMTGTSSTQWVPEYWIQNTKTSTNGHYTNATVADYGDQMAAWAPQQPGSCGVSAVIDWGGGTNGNTPAVADLEASTHGDYSQPNADRAMTSDEDAPGVWHAYANGITYNTNAYVPLQTTRNCPFYSGSGTTAAQVGLDQPTSNTGNDPETLIFDTPAETVTAWICMEGTMPTSVRGTDDVFLIGRAENNDYANIQWNSNGSTTSWELETKGGTPSTTVGWKQNTWYGFSLTYSGNGGNHSLSVYSFPSPKCQGTATLMQTITAQGVGAGPADSIRVFGTYANEYPSGYHWYMGAILLDYLYGSQLLP